VISVLAVLTLAVLPARDGAGADVRPHPDVLPGLGFEDQTGGRLDLGSLRGRIVVIVYGGRAGLNHHVSWGKRIDQDLRARGAYGPADHVDARPVRILALAQMGGIPEVFRPVLRRVLRQHVEEGFSLWLDWEDRMSAVFGARDPDSTVVVADRAGRVRLVAWGKPDGAPWQAVSEALQRLL
jgi:hypothetical protein